MPNPFFGQIPAWSPLGRATISQAQLLKPFPRFQNVIFFRNNVGNSSYNALYSKLEKRFSRGLTFLVSYTFSKLLDDASSVFDSSLGLGSVANFPVADSFNRRLERDVSSGDIPHVFAVSYRYELPAGAGRLLNPGGIWGKLASGWQIAGSIVAQSGLPLSVTQTTNNNAFAGFATQRPSCMGNPNLPAGEQTTERFFNTAAFAATPQFQLGTCSRNPVRGPHYRNADIAVIKDTAVSEGAQMELRAEVFNVTNTPPLGNPNTTVGNPSFGRITSAGDPRVIQLAVKLKF